MRSPACLHDLLVSALFTEGLDHDPHLASLGFSAVWIKGADLGAVARAFAENSLEELVEEPESISSALALIGRVTGTDVAADWLEATHSRIRPAVTC